MRDTSLTDKDYDEADPNLQCKKAKVVEPNVTLIPVMPTIDEADEELISLGSTQSLNLHIDASSSDMGKVYFGYCLVRSLRGSF